MSISSVSDRDAPRKGSLEAEDKSAPNADERDWGDEDADVDIDESSPIGVVPLDTDLDDVEEAEGVEDE
jgi:hypothetical protein